MVDGGVELVGDRLGARLAVSATIGVGDLVGVARRSRDSRARAQHDGALGHVRAARAPTAPGAATCRDEPTRSSVQVDRDELARRRHARIDSVYAEPRDPVEVGELRRDPGGEIVLADSAQRIASSRRRRSSAAIVNASLIACAWP